MISDLYRLYLECSGVSTDSRKIAPGSIFFALKGPNFDANAFAEQALKNGAAYAVIDDRRYKKGSEYIMVADALKTLQNLAGYHRNKLLIPFLAITGSNGKTTTKELIAGILMKRYKTAYTRGNLNNHIGAPLTILSITHDTQVAIIEMGANKPGDIEELCKIAGPTHGLITNIGAAHIEGFGSFEGVIKAKSELYNSLIQNDGAAFINSQNPVLFNLAKRFNDPVYYPAKGDFIHVEFIKADPFVVYRDENGTAVQTNLVGAYNFENIAAALCVGKYFDIPADQANDAVREYLPSNNRSQLHRTRNNSVLLDAYNANPSSMKAAIENLDAMKSDNKAAILGDMFELGESSETEHRKLGKLIASKGFNKVFFCGENMKWASEAYPQAHYFQNKAELKEELKTLRLKDFLILIKASRGMALEDVLDAIE